MQKKERKMSRMPYRSYIRYPDQTVSDKTVTGNPEVAEAAFRALLKPRKSVTLAILSLNSRPLMHVRLDRPFDPEMEVKLWAE